MDIWRTSLQREVRILSVGPLHNSALISPLPSLNLFKIVYLRQKSQRLKSPFQVRPSHESNEISKWTTKVDKLRNRPFFPQVVVTSGNWRRVYYCYHYENLS